MKALIFGSIGTLAETSELQRDAFNRAFRAAGLDWEWTPEIYAPMLTISGGRDRIVRYAESRGESVDADALHAEKSRLFQQRLLTGIALRDGVAETMAQARLHGWKLALAATTSAANIDALLTATALGHEVFDMVLDPAQVAQPKPAPDVYHAALRALALDPADALAIEDNPDGFGAARAAGLDCIAFPGAMHDLAAFDGAVTRQTVLDLSFLTETTP